MAMNQQDLIRQVEHLQTFFSIPRHICISKDDTKRLFSAVALCIRQVPMAPDQLSYVRSNLGFGSSTTPQALAHEVEHYRDTKVVDDCTRYSRIDTLLRNIVTALRDYKAVLSGDEIHQVATCLRPLAEMARVR